VAVEHKRLQCKWPWSTGGFSRLIANICTNRCNGAPSQARKTSHDEDASTLRDAASHGRAMRLGAMGQERQWPWSTGGSRRPIAHIGTRGPMAHHRGRAKPCFNRFFREQLPEIRNGEDATTGRDAASERKTLQ